MSPVTKVLGGPRRFLLGGTTGASSKVEDKRPAPSGASLARRAIQQNYLSASKPRATVPRTVESPGSVTAVVDGSGAPRSSSLGLSVGVPVAAARGAGASPKAGSKASPRAAASRAGVVTRELSSTPTGMPDEENTTPVKALKFAASPTAAAACKRTPLSPTHVRVYNHA